MNRDRGTIKWTAMMLPEHVQLLREWQAEDQLVEKPKLDEAQLEQMNSHLQRAYKERCVIHFKVWEQTSIYNISGIIQKVNPYEQSIQLENGQKFSLDLICETSIEGE
jgi:hypothetical protein